MSIGANQRLTPAGSLPRSAALALVARDATHMDLAAVNAQGNIVTTWWSAAAGWANATYAISTGGAFEPGGPLQLVARGANHLDVFAMGLSGMLLTNWWDAAGASWWNTNASPPQTPASAPAFGSAGAIFGAVARSPSQLDVFAMSPGKRLASSWWDANATCDLMSGYPNAKFLMTPCWQNQPWLP